MLKLFIATISALFIASLSFSQENKDSLFVFVGKRIKVTQLHPHTDSSHMIMDGYFDAKYRIVQTLYGRYKKSTIEFTASDHFGRPDFSRFKTVLLFLYIHNGHYFHLRYQYFDVYKTTNGRWAAPGDPYYFDERYRTNTVRAVPIIFRHPVSFHIEGADSAKIKEIFPIPYFKLEGNKAIAQMGAYAEDLLTVKKEGILKAWGYFK